MNLEILNNELIGLIGGGDNFVENARSFKERYPGPKIHKRMVGALLHELIDTASFQVEANGHKIPLNDFIRKNDAILELIEIMGSGGLYQGLVIKYADLIRKLPGAMIEENRARLAVKNKKEQPPEKVLSHWAKDLLIKAGAVYETCRRRSYSPETPYPCSETSDVLSIRWVECPICSWMGKIRYLLHRIITFGRFCEVCKGKKGWFWDPEK